MKYAHVCVNLFRLLENATDTFSYYVAGLSPYKQYSFRVAVGHTHGQTVSPWATLLTAEDGRFTYPHTHAHIQCVPFADPFLYTFADPFKYTYTNAVKNETNAFNWASPKSATC